MSKGLVWLTGGGTGIGKELTKILVVTIAVIVKNIETINTIGQSLKNVYFPDLEL